jgi:hypothetical protein
MNKFSTRRKVCGEKPEESIIVVLEVRRDRASNTTQSGLSLLMEDQNMSLSVGSLNSPLVESGMVKLPTTGRSMVSPTSST